jgi:sporulation related protein
MHMKKSGLSLVFSLFVLLGISGHAAAQSTRYTIQLEATPELEVALEKVKGFKGQGLDAYIVKTDVQGKGTFYRIRVGNFPTQAGARKYAADLQRLGFSSDFFIAIYERPQGDFNEAAATRGVATPAAGKPTAPPANAQPKEDVKQPAPSAPATAPPADKQPVKEPVKQPSAVANNATVAAPPASTPPPKEEVKQPSAVANNATATAPPASTPPAKEDVKQPSAVANNATVTAPPASTPPAKEDVKQTAPPANTLAANISTPTTNPITPSAGVLPTPIAPAGVVPAISFVKFQDQAIGYSFDRPQTWEGGQFDSKDVQDQKGSAGAVFKSAQDTAFITAIWHSLDKANSSEHDNDLFVSLILESMGSDAGTQEMTETGRKVVNEGGAIKTYIDLKATFKAEGPEGPLDFLGKGVIARTNKGILLVVAFYWKGGPPHVSGVADKIIKSVSAPL